MCPPSSPDYLCRRLFSVVYATGCLPPGKDVKAACLEALATCYIWPRVGQFTGYWTDDPGDGSRVPLGHGPECSGPCLTGRLALCVFLREPLDRVQGELIFSDRNPLWHRALRFLFVPSVDGFFEAAAADFQPCGQDVNVLAERLRGFEEEAGRHDVVLGGSVSEDFCRRLLPGGVFTA